MAPRWLLGMAAAMLCMLALGASTVAATNNKEDATPAQRMTWAQRLRRVFRIDVQTCPKCGGTMKIIACIDEEVVIEKILAHIDAQVLPPDAVALPSTRAPPQFEIDGDWQ